MPSLASWFETAQERLLTRESTIKKWLAVDAFDPRDDRLCTELRDNCTEML
jgi:hypothetical protein